MTEQDIARKSRGKWIAISASILGPIVVILAILISVGCYAHRHPDGVISYLLFRNGIRLFEPSFTDRQEPSDLLAGFKSYESVSNIQEQLNDRGAVAELKSYNTNGSHGGLKRLTTKMITVCGQSGSLSLDFFNDRLWWTTFYPSNRDAFPPAFEKEYNLSFTATNAVPWSSHSIAELNFRRNKQTKKSEPVVTIFDDRLRRELNAWDVRYSRD